jgi:hypothetical protein
LLEVRGRGKREEVKGERISCLRRGEGERRGKAKKK